MYVKCGITMGRKWRIPQIQLGLLHTITYISKFPFIYSKFPAAPAYGVYISQLIRYYRGCGSYHDFLARGLLLIRKVLVQGFLVVNLRSSLRKFHGRHHDNLAKYLCHKWPRMCSVCRYQNPIFSTLMTYHRICYTTGATCGAGAAYPSGASEFSPSL